MAKCIGCLVECGEGYYFCSYTCACLTGYFSVKGGWIKDPSKLKDSKAREKYYKNPVREHPNNKENYL